MPLAKCQSYAMGQHRMCCEELGVHTNPEEDGHTLLEAVCDLNASFKLRYEADMRAIKMWQKAHPDKKLTWPDHADLVVWLMEQIYINDTLSE